MNSIMGIMARTLTLGSLCWYLVFLHESRALVSHSKVAFRSLQAHRSGAALEAGRKNSGTTAVDDFDQDAWEQDDWDFDFDDEDDEDAYFNAPLSATVKAPEESPPDDMGKSNNQQQQSHFFSQKTLRDPSYRVSDEIFESLCRGANIQRPSKIQNLAWPVLLEGKPAIVADQTGSGKTLAYLIPLLQRALSQPKIKAPGTPRILVLSPTAELADQTRAVCDKLSSHTKFKTMVVTASGKFSTSIRDQIRLLQRTPMDVLISTPGRLSTILRTKNAGLDLSELSAIVLDEVDVLLVDETFGPQLRTVGAAAPVDKTQFVFVTATLPNEIVETVEKEFPGVVQVRGPGLHRVAPTVKERLVDVSVPPRFNRDAAFCFDVKAEQLLKALRETRCRRTLIFCNTVESCRDVENRLKRSDRRGQILEVLPYHNALTTEARNENLAIFSKGRKGAAADKTDYVLVCTDRAARGVDFEAAPVDHVVIFDFPKDPAEYVRRVGRTARAGRSGTSTVFAFGWQLPIARSVMKKTVEISAAYDLARQEDEEDENQEYSQSKRRKRGRGRNNGNDIVKTSIEGKKLWK